jgi:hypothetical protein
LQRRQTISQNSSAFGFIKFIVAILTPEFVTLPQNLQDFPSPEKIKEIKTENLHRPQPNYDIC